MLHPTSVLRYIKLYLGQRFDIVDKDFYLDVIEELSLPTFSKYYPRRISGINITESCAIREYNPTVKLSLITKYKIPNYGEDVEYLDIANYYHPHNDRSSNLVTPYGNGSYFGAIAATRVMSAIPHSDTPFGIGFEPPDFIIMDPPILQHYDFTVDMKCVNKLYQILPTYKDEFMKLALLDIKMALYNKFINLRSSGTYGGIELNPMLDDFSSAESDREELLRHFREDSPKFIPNLKDYFHRIVY